MGGQKEYLIIKNRLLKDVIDQATPLAGGIFWSMHLRKKNLYEFILLFS